MKFTLLYYHETEGKIKKIKIKTPLMWPSLFYSHNRERKKKKRPKNSLSEIVLLGEYRCSGRVDGGCSTEVPVLVPACREWTFWRKVLQNREGKGMLGFLVSKILKVPPTNVSILWVFLGF